MKLFTKKIKKEEAKVENATKTKKTVVPSSVIKKKKSAFSLPRALSFLYVRHPTAGIALVDNILYGVILEEAPNSEEPAILASENVPLADNVIVKGAIVDPDAFAAALSKLRAKLKTPFCIFALPGKAWWARLFFFPISLTNKQFEESMVFHKSLDLPWDSQDVYSDWEEISINEPDKRSSLIVATKKPTVDAFLACLGKAGWTVLAVEPEALSMVRAIAYFETDSPALVMGFDGLFLEEMIIWRGRTHFSRVIELENNNPEEVKKIFDLELKRLYTYSLTEPLGMPKPAQVFLTGSFDAETLNKFTRSAGLMGLAAKIFAPSSLPWGTALRGLVPLSKDTFISLMPLGTEEAYARRRAVLFVELATNFAFVVAFILVLTFSAAFLFIRSQYQDTLNRLINLQGSTNQFTTTIASAEEFNRVSFTVSNIASRMPRWDLLYQKILDSTAEISDLKIVDLNFNSSGGIQIKGVVGTPQDLISFRNALQDNSLGVDIRIPPNLFESGSQGEFNLTFNLPPDSKLLFAP